MPERPELSVLGELLSLLTHDLRNPLSALHSNLGFLRSSLHEKDQDVLEAVEDGLVSCDGIAHIIDNIDLLGQVLKAAERPAGSVVDMAALVADVVASSQAMAQSHGVEVVVEERIERPMNAAGSRDMLARALANLLRNSIQHSPPGSRVRVSLRAEPGGLVARVSDDGAVLTGAAKAGAFTAAGQVASKSIPNGRYSRGLGLYSAHLAATAAHASVRIADKPGGGNAFELIVPQRA